MQMNVIIKAQLIKFTDSYYYYYYYYNSFL